MELVILAWLFGLPHLRCWCVFGIPVQYAEYKKQKQVSRQEGKAYHHKQTISNRENHGLSILEAKAVDFGSFW